MAEADLPNISQAKITNLVSDLSNKQDNLVSGTSIKTINGQSVLGSGNIIITGGEVDLTDYYDKTETYSKVETDSLVGTKQGTLVSGTSIKTINGQTVLGSGNIEITGGASLTNYYNKTETETLLSNKVDKVTGKGLSTNDFTDTFKHAYDGHLANTSNPHNTTANQVGAYSKIEVDNLLTNTETLLSITFV